MILRGFLAILLACATLAEAAANHDLVFTSGGVSVAVTRERAASLVASILSKVGQASIGVGDPAEVFLTEVVLDAWRRGKKAGFEEWAASLATPPQFLQKIEGLSLEDFFPKKDRMKVARALVGFKKGAARWLEGAPLNIESLVGGSKPKVSIFTLRHLTDEDDRHFFASLLFGAIRDYMFRAPASGALKLLVVLDEADGYIPPSPKNPSTKKPLCTLLAQGRAQGIGLVIATQNPVSLDYKALSNVNTFTERVLVTGTLSINSIVSPSAVIVIFN